MDGDGQLGTPIRSSALGTERHPVQSAAADASRFTGTGHVGAKVFGELAVHRESLSRILIENPESLAGILAALISAIPSERRPNLAEKDVELENMYQLTEV